MKFVDEQGERRRRCWRLRAYLEHPHGCHSVPFDAALDFVPAALQPLIRHDGRDGTAAAGRPRCFLQVRGEIQTGSFAIGGREDSDGRPASIEHDAVQRRHDVAEMRLELFRTTQKTALIIIRGRLRRIVGPTSPADSGAWWIASSSITPRSPSRPCWRAGTATVLQTTGGSFRLAGREAEPGASIRQEGEGIDDADPHLSGPSA